MSVYDKSFYEGHAPGSFTSASILLPQIFNTFSGVQSVIDVGCGIGTWLSVCKQNNRKVFGVDGNEFCADGKFLTKEEYMRVDLGSKIQIDKKFDLCISLEVAEHLDANRAESFVEDLCKLSDVILFSAAIPGQAGTHHVNCQWQNYWVDFFSKNGFQVFDLVRRQFWNDSRVEWWYLQNTLVFVNKKNAQRMQEAQFQADEINKLPFLDLVHPRSYESNHHELRKKNRKRKRLFSFLSR